MLYPTAFLDKNQHAENTVNSQREKQAQLLVHCTITNIMLYDSSCYYFNNNNNNNNTNNNKNDNLYILLLLCVHGTSILANYMRVI
jgi:hypothetical protein